MINLPLTDTVISEPDIDAPDHILSNAAVMCDHLDKEQDGLHQETMSIPSSPSEETMSTGQPPEMLSAIPGDETSSSYCSSAEVSELGFEPNATPIQQSAASFLAFRMMYLVVTLVVGLADGLQGKISNTFV
jgi:hypothetical protein